MVFWKKKNWDEEFDENYADRIRDRPQGLPGRIWPHLLIIFLCGVLFVGAAGVVGGQSVFEQTLLALCQPVGLTWISLILLIYFGLLFRQTWLAILAMFAWLVLSVAGNGYIAHQLASRLEADFLQFQVKDLPPLDIVVVLGGGTETRLSGDPQLGISGDRVATAAQLFHLKKASKFICTGSQEVKTKTDRHPREEAAELLVRMGIPSERIEQLKGGNTVEEAANFVTYFEAQPPTGAANRPEIGLITSAWHLPRAIKLFEAQGIEVVPVPSNFLSKEFLPTPNTFIPSPGSLRTTQLATKELLARMLGR